MQKIDISAQKIHSFFLKTYNIVIATFQVWDKLDYLFFDLKTFLLADLHFE